MQKSAGQTPFKPLAVVLWLRPREDVEVKSLFQLSLEGSKHKNWTLFLRKFINIQCDQMEITILRFPHCYITLLCVPIMHKIINFIVMLPWFADNTI